MHMMSDLRGDSAEPSEWSTLNERNQKYDPVVGASIIPRKQSRATIFEDSVKELLDEQTSVKKLQELKADAWRVVEESQDVIAVF